MCGNRQQTAVAAVQARILPSRPQPVVSGRLLGQRARWRSPLQQSQAQLKMTIQRRLKQQAS